MKPFKIISNNKYLSKLNISSIFSFFAKEARFDQSQEISILNEKINFNRHIGHNLERLRIALKSIKYKRKFRRAYNSYNSGRLGYLTAKQRIYFNMLDKI